MDREFVIKRLRAFEGCIPHMYRCTGGEVTIGVGHAIQAAADAANFSWRIGERPATAAEILADYGRIAGAEMGMRASGYAGMTQCRMADPDMDRLCLEDVDRFTARLEAALPNWNKYPPQAQAALFDMAFNLGLGGLLKFHKLLAAVDAGDWETAAKECHRQGIGEDRNRQTAELFKQAKPPAPSVG